MAKTLAVPVLPRVCCWAQQIDSLRHKNQDHPTWILGQAVCFYTAPVGQMLKMFQISVIKSKERGKIADFSAFGVMLHTAFHSVFKLCICSVPTPFCYFQPSISPMNRSGESHIGINAVAFVNTTKKLLTPTRSPLQSHQYRSSGSPGLLTLAWGQEATLVLIIGDQSDNHNCFLLSFHLVSSLNRQIMFDCLLLVELTAPLGQLYGSISE